MGQMHRFPLIYIQNGGPRYKVSAAYNKFIKIIRQEMSLPRIRTLSELAVIQDQPRLKFKKLKFDDEIEKSHNTNNAQQKKHPLKTMSSARLQSLQRYSTVQEQREYRNEKIHLNLIEKKLLAGTYDEQKETGDNLKTIKSKLDTYRADIQSKIKEIERIRIRLEDTKKQSEVQRKEKEKNDSVLEQMKRRYGQQQMKTDKAKQSKGIFEHMILTRKAINLHMSKVVYETKFKASKLQSSSELASHSQQHYGQKCINYQSQLQVLKVQAQRLQQNRQAELGKEQQKISKRVQDEEMMKQKSKEFIDRLDEKERQIELKIFGQGYTKVLGHLFIRRYTTTHLQQLRDKCEEQQYYYNSLLSYKTFQAENPATFVERFIEHPIELKQLESAIQAKEAQTASLEKVNVQLKQTWKELELDTQAQSEHLTSQMRENNDEKTLLAISRVKKQNQDIQNRYFALKKWIARMLKRLSLKGEKKNMTAKSFAGNFNLILQEINQEISK